MDQASSQDAPAHRQQSKQLAEQQQEDIANDLAVQRDGKDARRPQLHLAGPPARPIIRVPQCAIPLQSSILKRIASFHTKEELLQFVSKYHILLDPINLVTSLYRLAKMSPQRNRSTYLTELQASSTFQLLLRSIGSQFTYGQLQHLKCRAELKGLDARCLANLIWALAKLDLSADDGALSSELAGLAAPFVVRCVHTSSPQGLANLLWGYSKLPSAPPEVIRALTLRITNELHATLRSDWTRPFDAQALSNSIWALSHLKSRGVNLEAIDCAPLKLLDALAQVAGGMLVRLQGRGHPPLQRPGAGGRDTAQECMRFLAACESDFSAQALVNIAYSFASLLGPACTSHASIRRLFNLMHGESVNRLQATAEVLRSGALLPSGGGFNEQALSNAVYAFERAGLLQPNLLAAVFSVAVLRLQRCIAASAGAPRADAGGGSNTLMTFKPQELCTLLKVCHSGLAPPWEFLSTLMGLLGAHPAILDNWTPMEKHEVQRALSLLKQHVEGVGMVRPRSASPHHHFFPGGGQEPRLSLGYELQQQQQQRHQQQQGLLQRDQYLVHQQQQWWQQGMQRRLSFDSLSTHPYVQQVVGLGMFAGAQELHLPHEGSYQDMRQLLLPTPAPESVQLDSEPLGSGAAGHGWWGWSASPSPAESPSGVGPLPHNPTWGQGA